MTHFETIPAHISINRATSKGSNMVHTPVLHPQSLRHSRSVSSHPSALIKKISCSSIRSADMTKNHLFLPVTVKTRRKYKMLTVQSKVLSSP